MLCNLEQIRGYTVSNNTTDINSFINLLHFNVYIFGFEKSTEKKPPTYTLYSFIEMFEIQSPQGLPCPSTDF